MHCRYQLSKVSFFVSSQCLNSLNPVTKGAKNIHYPIVVLVMNYFTSKGLPSLTPIFLSLSIILVLFFLPYAFKGN